MEIRDIQIIKTENSQTECEIYVGNVSKDVLAKARNATGYQRPRIYINGIYDHVNEDFRVNRIEEDTCLYTRGSKGDIIPIQHLIQPKTMNSISILVRNNMKSRGY